MWVTWAESWKTNAATEHPKWRRRSEATSLLLSEVERYVQAQSSGSSCKRQMRAVEDFVFNVNSNECEGSDTVAETRYAISKHRKRQLAGLRAEPPPPDLKLLSNELEAASMDKVKTDVNLYDAFTLLVEEWCNEDRFENNGVPSLRLSRIKHLHFVLFHDRDLWEEAGQFRREPVYIRLPDDSFLDMEPHTSIARALEKLVGETNIVLEDIFAGDEQTRVRRLIYLATAFFLAFEEIHPFIDGNGRTGRLLLSYLLASITPFGPNNFYLLDGQEQEPLLADRWDYLSCFPQKKTDVRHPFDLISLVIEGIYVGWKFFYK